MEEKWKGGILTAYIYPKVISAMKATGIRQEKLAENLGITPRSMRNKLTGKTPLTLDEAIAIRDSVAPGRDLEALFRKAGPS